ncbi:MAG: NAD-dependent epimerase/dehydratase family protein [Deltaproteobacteria bacterium]|nr:NAD-dependent epimerase/dehydratase family protein [Deltaproteobacteria bacterium]
MRILITGGRGLIGSHVARALAEQRPECERHLLTHAHGGFPDGVSGVFHRGDVTRPETLPPALHGIDVVIHCVQFPNHPVENPRRGWTYERVDGDGTAAVVAAAKASGVRRFIYLSGAGAGPDRPQPWFRAKWRAEEAIRASGMEYVIFRPSLVYGPEDRSLNRFIGMIRRLPLVPVIGDGKQHVQPVHVDDLAALIVRSIDGPSTTNQVFEVGGPAMTMDDLLRAIGRALGTPRRLVHLPKALVKAAAAALQWLPGRPITPAAVEFITMDVVVDTRGIERVFAWRPRSLAVELSRIALR